MITEKELHEAIAECQGTRNPNANTCMKLASYYTILDHIGEKAEAKTIPMQGYSYSPSPTFEAYSSESEFGTIVKDIDYTELMRVMDEAMETMRIMVPRLYDAIMRQLTALK